MSELGGISDNYTQNIPLISETSEITIIDNKQVSVFFDQTKFLTIFPIQSLQSTSNLVVSIPYPSLQKDIESIFLNKPNKLEVFEKQKLFFEENLNNLLTRYKGKYVAIMNEKVVDSNKNEIRLIKKIYKKYGYVLVYIKKVSNEKLLLRVSSPRIKGE